MLAIKRFSALALSAVLLLLTGCSSGTQADDSIATGGLLINRATTYNTTAAELTDLVKNASIKVEPVYTERRDMVSGSETLVFKSFRVSRGGEFKQGDLLAVLTGTGSQSDVKQLSLELDYARASYEENCEAMEEAIEAAEKAAASDAYAERLKELNLEKQRAGYELYVLTTEASLEALKTRLETAQASLGEQYVYAPYDGKVKSLANVFEGDVLDPHTVLMTIYNADSLVMFSNSTSGLLVYNMEVSITYEENDEVITLPGRVVSSRELLSGFMNANIYIKLDTPAEINPRNDIAATSRYTLLKNVVIVPRTGVSSESGMYYLTLLDGSTTRKRYIIRGPQQNDDVAVLQGAQAGQLVITNQYTS